MASASPPAEGLDSALATLSSQPWAAQEACYSVLLKLLQNLVQNPEEPKFRTVKRGNAAIKAKVLDCPGGADVLLRAGFVEGPETYVLPPDASVEALRSVLERLQNESSLRLQDHLRAERDEKIARERAADAKLNEMGGFARGRHKLGGDAAAPAATTSASAPLEDPATKD
mmetsp:Transcript_39055/g.107603  ORF Transcript_39055/g.107603 Transcript_39055/m.107603 type:complete len:171 (-) Transcript_39055:84-596(-)